jgi:hypothetical protein
VANRIEPCRRFVNSSSLSVTLAAAAVLSRAIDCSEKACELALPATTVEERVVALLRG